ncbi:uncharacterized protein LOC114453553 [Parambassis ranga]|uniref:Uncharacterized protein LOC114453553 n=1 Tax=Parambassis ranga TaxID=210632 RepID=A0A6P7KLT6_9TELE|nr:uncharacterized protein LOC114453553 [Parambassis ranga]
MFCDTRLSRDQLELNSAMAGIKCVAFLGVQSLLWTLSRGDPDMSCVHSQSCILPCSFQGGRDVVLHWIQMIAGDPHAHSFYHNQDQLEHQNQRFRNRTSLFKDQISRGNTSLLLTEVKVQDQGRYKCYTSTMTGTKESFITLRVDAPVSKVDIQQEGNRISCSSEGIYPQPELTWSTRPPSIIHLQNSSTVQQTEQQLYTISSSLILSDSHTDLTYSCTVTTRRNSRRALIKSASISGSDSETTISCSASDISLYDLIWRFNHSQTILTKTRTETKHTVSEEWRQHVKSVSESGSLTLQHLSSNQEGLYTCELTDEEETITTNTFMGSIGSHQGDSSNIGAIIGPVVTVLVIVIVILSVVCCKKRKCCIKRKRSQSEKDQQTNTGKPESKSAAESGSDSDTNRCVSDEDEESPLKQQNPSDTNHLESPVCEMETNGHKQTQKLLSPNMKLDYEHIQLCCSSVDLVVFVPSECGFSQSCILPCSFQGGEEAVLHWIQTKEGNPIVHSFYFNQDQLGHQDHRFRNRTSLFKDQISRGNASLQLTEVKVQDEERYKCYTSTIRRTEESFITLRVDAPVSKVDIQQEGNRISCSSEGIYPRPELTWSTRPPSIIHLQNSSTVQQTEQQLYTISSSLILSDSHTDLTYSCTVTTRRNSRRALIKSASISGSDSETTISCSASDISLYDLIWRFNHSQTILTKTRTETKHTVSEEWRQHVKSVSESGSLTLQHLSSNQEGLYTCELTDEEETITTNTFMGSIGSHQGDSSNVGAIIVPVVTGLVIVIVTLSVVYWKKRKACVSDHTQRGGSSGRDGDIGGTPLQRTSSQDGQIPSDNNSPAAAESGPDEPSERPLLSSGEETETNRAEDK